MLFWNPLAFFLVHGRLAICSLLSLLFFKPSWSIWKFSVMYCWSLAWRTLSMTVLACGMSTAVRQCEHSLASPFSEIGEKMDLFQSCGRSWVSSLLALHRNTALIYAGAHASCSQRSQEFSPQEKIVSIFFWLFPLMPLCELGDTNQTHGGSRFTHGLVRPPCCYTYTAM